MYPSYFVGHHRSASSMGVVPAPMSVGGVNKKSQQERALLQVMQREIERLEEERIQLKTENRKMAVQLGHKAAQLGLDAQDLKAIQEYRDALKERRRNMSKGRTSS